jgi:hypothetical protein
MRIRFNDGGHAACSGSFAWEMPPPSKSSAPHAYGTEPSEQLIRPSAERSVYMTGPLMSSTESYAVRRPDLLSFIEDQLKLGVYKTRKVDMKVGPDHGPGRKPSRSSSLLPTVPA